MSRVHIIRTYLELRDPAALREPRSAPLDVQTYERHAPGDSQRYRTLYHAVGERWLWRDRQWWSDERLAAHLASPRVAVWELFAAGDSAGFFELEHHDAGDVEIVYFGLRPEHIGRSHGGAMLVRAVREAWALQGDAGPGRVWLHTCNLDSPQALPNYLARGFRVFGRDEYDREG